MPFNRHQLIGFGEAYLTGAWDAPDLGGFLTVLAAEISDLVPRPLQAMRSLVVKRPPRTQRSSKQNSRSNIAHHYDLSNDLFELFLDQTLSYSCALFEGDPSEARVADLVGRPVAKVPGVGQWVVGAGRICRAGTTLHRGHPGRRPEVRRTLRLPGGRLPGPRQQPG